MKKRNVLILCTGNSARSQMAEGLLRDMSGDLFDVYSAGMEPKGLNPLAVKAMSEIGIDISHHRSKSVTEYLGRMMVHFLIIVCSNANGSCPRIFPGMIRKYYWPFDDPAAEPGTEEQKLAKFREVRDQISVRLREWVDEVKRVGVDNVIGGKLGQ